MDIQRKRLFQLVAEGSSITNEALARFSNLITQQLNFKPSADQWSVAQCFDHLVNANEAYFPTFREILSGDKRNTFWESLPFLPSVWGKLVIKAVAPQNTRKRKNPQIFDPSSSTVDDNIIRRFIDQQNEILCHMKASEKVNVENIIISSPVSKLIT